MLKTIQLIGLFLCFPMYLFSQQIDHAQDFKIGTTLTFQNCNGEGVSAGERGMNQTWDFSSLKEKSTEIITEKMVAPEDTPKHKVFPIANLVEKYSDGRSVYLFKKKNENLMLGFVGAANDITIKYKKPLLVAKRPIKYGDSIMDTYKTAYSVRGMNFKGGGTVNLTVDGSGTLILPNGTYQNVLRVKTAQIQNDTIEQYLSVTETKTTTYTWFDKNHTSALLKISKIESNYFDQKTVGYLLKETD